MIPWNEIEQRYAQLFESATGNVAKPLRLALGALIIQAEYGYSDEETVLQIQEGPVVYNQVRNLEVEKGHWKFQDVVAKTNREEATNDQDQGYHVL